MLKHVASVFLVLWAVPAIAWYDGVEYVPGEAVFATDSSVSQLVGDYKLRKLNRGRQELMGGTFLIQFNKRLEGEELRDKALELAKSVNARFVEPNLVFKLNEVPNDPLFGDLYGLDNQGQTGGTIGADIKAVEAWDTSVGSKDILVAIIDTGVDYEHPDLKENIWQNAGELGLDEEGEDKSSNGIDDDGNGYIDDVQGWDFYNDDNDPMDDHDHGTHCAGTVGAVGNNDVGVVGVNWNVSMLPVKIFSGRGRTTVAAATEGIYYSNDMGVHISSNSWGGTRLSSAIKEAVEESESLGVLFIAAAGNSNNDTDTKPHYPSGYQFENIISVAATDHDDKLASFSNYGLKTVDLAAPGVNIYSTKPGAKYRYMSGTSMAAPHVAGAAALLWSVYPEADFVEIKDRLLSGTESMEAHKKPISNGRLNIMGALTN